MTLEDRSSAENDKVSDGSQILRASLTHLRFGWWSLLIYLTLGIMLETLHGFKIGIYLDVSNETRRLTWTLAHAHGTLISLINLAFSSSLLRIKAWNARSLQTCSVCLIGATLLMPAGFFLGGVFIHAGDPGLGVILVPIGAFMLMGGVFLIARAADGLGRQSAAKSEAAASDLARKKSKQDKIRK